MYGYHTEARRNSTCTYSAGSMANLFSSQTAKKRRRSRSDSADFSSSGCADAATNAKCSISTVARRNENDNDDDADDAPGVVRLVVATTPPPETNPVDLPLPVHAYRREILHAIQQNKHEPIPKVLLITAETGSGKSTQIPAYFLHHTHHVMAVTQPRRVAAVTLAHRVVWEQTMAHRQKSGGSTTTAASAVPSPSSRVGQQIGYRVRFDDCTSTNTQLVYVTDGMLLREAMMDPMLSRYSIVFLDEAHERSLQTDILMGVVQRARLVRSQQRRPLHVVVMSATLQLESFTNFFGKDSTHIIQIPGRQFPVQLLYTQTVQEDYLESALATILQIHEHETADDNGDILVFLPGQEEIESLAVLLKQQLTALCPNKNEPADGSSASVWTGDRVEVFNVGTPQEQQSSNLIAGVLVCVLYAALPPEAQLAAFAEKPSGCTRKVILATNIAETSVTLPAIRYVVDTGKHKSRYVAAATGMESLMVSDISQAQAAQRAGRAGRVQAGICFRLYTEDAFHTLPGTSVPEILRVNLAQVVLQLQGMGIKDPTSFEFVTPPNKASLVRATKLLYALGALDGQMQLTTYGKKLAKLPLDPVFGHLLLQSAEYSCVKEMLSVVSVLSADNLFYRPAGEGVVSAKVAAAHRRFVSHEGDLPTYLNVYQAWQREAVYTPPSSGGHKAQKRMLHKRNEKQANSSGKLLLHHEWCQRNFVAGRALARAFSVRMQLRNLCGRPMELNGLGMDTSSSSGSDRERFLKCIAAGLFLQVASRIKTEDEADQSRGRSGFVGSTRGRFLTKVGNDIVSVHPTSFMFNRQPAPKCVVYTELVTTKKSYIRGVTQIREEWLPEVAPNFYHS